MFSFPPTPDDTGLDLGPNTASSMGVKMSILERKPPPYTSFCMEKWSEPANYSLTVGKTMTLLSFACFKV